MQRPYEMMKAIVLGIWVLLAAGLANAQDIRIGGDGGWTIGKFNNMTAEVGDVLVFEYPPIHTVATVGNMACDFAGGKFLAGKLDSPFYYELTEAGTVIFASDVPGHCEGGMVFAVEVVGEAGAEVFHCHDDDHHHCGGGDDDDGDDDDEGGEGWPAAENGSGVIFVRKTNEGDDDDEGGEMDEPETDLGPASEKAAAEEEEDDDGDDD